MGYTYAVLGRLGRRLGVLAVIAAVIYVARGYGRAPAVLAGLGCVFLVATVAVWLPRAAHAAFRRGSFARSSLYYGALRRVSPDREVRAAADVSVAACELGAERFERALARLDRVAVDDLSEPARCAWLNNRAYALARGELDATEALRCSDEVIELRPEAGGFRHTRGIALLALGRIDDAIRELDAVWRAHGSEGAPPLLEAERCYDLARAWRRKGEPDYARDYFERARRAAPGSAWAARAERELGDHRHPTGAVLPDVG